VQTIHLCATGPSSTGALYWYNALLTFPIFVLCCVVVIVGGDNVHFGLEALERWSLFDGNTFVVALDGDQMIAVSHRSSRRVAKWHVLLVEGVAQFIRDKDTTRERDTHTHTDIDRSVQFVFDNACGMSACIPQGIAGNSNDSLATCFGRETCCMVQWNIREW
jgi:hypothetical protein